jgi:glycosyltransferase involved in cell wall biosynthesis
LLFVGRLAPEKRVGEIIEAVSELEYRLRIAGTGPLGETLERESPPNVELLGFVSEEEKLELLAECEAVVFNSDREPFGIVPTEASASGKPVVGVRDGFTRYQIEDGVNGVLFDRGKGNMKQSIEKVYNRQWDPETIQKTAKKYDISKFEADWKLLMS